MDESVVLKYELFYCYFTGDCCWVTVEEKHVSTMGVTDLLTKFGETENTDSYSVSPVIHFSLLSYSQIISYN